MSPVTVRDPEGITAVMARANRHLAKPKSAFGRCYQMAVRTQVAFRQRGTDPSTLVEAHWDSDLSRGNHFAVEVDGTVYDLTLRQFAPDSDFPWVGSVEEWRRLLSDATGSPISIRVSL